MKSLFIAAAFALSIASYGQCIKCSSIEEALKDPAKVKSISINPNVGGEYLEEIPADIKLFINLEELMLTDHGLMAVPKEIGTLAKLKTLSLAGNALEELPEEIFQLKNLKELILFDNAFSEEYLQELKEKTKKELPKVKLMTD
ncbi:hypothetical protein OGH69_03350 [Flavobacterium sp. MFBS3-15]|uniref:leucine-rich repeat domain-containing protein n=1 Tax=Flavobacterium sp. MFBS3-15 TaxID=2989816 RepID=UPI002235A534|nr:hypothetical protein [Flavobacterium sp. MFBS3-15]MCW4467990.1 hypothetical protein [Flavobacterium sp. MFBS3-15]